MPNSTNRKNLKNMIDLMSDGHNDVTQMAARTNNALLKLDDYLINTGGGPAEGIHLRAANRYLNELQGMLDSHKARIGRVREEIQEIQKNIQVICHFS